MAQFHSCLSDEIYQYASATMTHIRIIFQFIITKEKIFPFLTTMWYHMDGFTNQCRCSSAIYLLSFLYLECYITIYGVVGSSGHVKDVVDGLNARNKCITKLEMPKLLNPKFIQDDSIIFKFMQVHENEEDQSVISSK